MHQVASSVFRTALPFLCVASVTLAVAHGAKAQATGGRVTFGGGGSASPSGAGAGAAAAATPASPAPSAAPEAPADGDAEWAERDRQLNEASTLSGPVGLLRLRHAQGGEVGQFRLGFTTEWFSATFLCSDQHPCANPRGGAPITGTSDSQSARSNHIGATLSLGVTLAKLGSGMLEGYMTTGGYANSNDANRPALLQVLGDSNLGFKYGAPLSKVFYLGGFAEMWLVNGTGSVGLDGSSTSAKFGPIATVDLRGTESRTPLRFGTNIVYSLDNTAGVLETTEQQRGKPVTRVERYGLKVNRVDHIDLHIGGEAFLAEDKVRPFIEYTVLIPSNRQNYACRGGDPTRNPNGDACLANESVAPSALTIGGRFFPWKRGFSLLAAVDIGVSGTSKFIEEMSPQAPWTMFIGAGWAVDTQDRPPVVRMKTVEKKVEVVKAPVRGHIAGFVHEQGKQDPVANAIVSFESHPDINPLYGGADGKFHTLELPDGDYKLAVKAEGYKPGVCEAKLVKGQDTTADCAVEALPRVGNIVGVVRDADTNVPIGNVQVKVVDSSGKELAVTADGGGAFRFENVPPGDAKVMITADGYLTFVQAGEVKVRQDNRLEIMLRPKPKTAQVEVRGKEIVIKQQVQFQSGSAVILPESFGLLTEVADTFIRHPEIKVVEIQGHTDNVGPADYNKQLSEQRAEAVKAWLEKHGVMGSRMTAHGYGPDKPLVPNVTAGNRARNRRVQFIITDPAK